MKPIKGGRIITTVENQELIKEGDSLKKVTIHNLSENEINVVINKGNKIPISPDESIRLGNLKVISIIIVEKNSTVRYIGV
jgi:hypothetical protein